MHRFYFLFIVLFRPIETFYLHDDSEGKYDYFNESYEFDNVL